jgi:endoglucanase
MRFATGRPCWSIGPAPSLRWLPLATLSALTALLGACSDSGDPVGPNLDDLACAADAVTADGTSVPVAPGGFAVVGNQIIDSGTCEPHRLVGVSLSYLAYEPAYERAMADATVAEDIAQIKSWNANVVRIALNQAFWVKTSRHYNPGYAERVDRIVRQARTAGMSVILDLHVTDRGDPNYTFNDTNPHQQHADVNHSIPFWKEVAKRYKDDGGVIFELYNEAYNISWDVWLNGGMIPDSVTYGEPRKAFQAAGYQQLYDAVRSIGADNLVIVAGTHWGYYLDGVAAHRVKGYNIAYAAHPWNWSDKQPDRWDADWGLLAQTDPVIVSEFGSYDCRTGYVDSVLDYADRNGLSWMAWAWKAPEPWESASQARPEDPICSFPMLITDWAGTPSQMGRAIRSRLQSY